MNRFSYYITTHFIPSNKDYNSYCNSHSVYQTYPKYFKSWKRISKIKPDLFFFFLFFFFYPV